MFTETVRPFAPSTPATAIVASAPAGLLSGIAVAVVNEKSLCMPVPPPPPAGATDALISCLTLATSTLGLLGFHWPVGDHRKSMWLSSLSLHQRPPSTLPVLPTSRM